MVRRASALRWPRHSHKQNCPPCRFAIRFIFFIVPPRNPPVSSKLSFWSSYKVRAGQLQSTIGSTVRACEGEGLTIPCINFVESRTSFPMLIVICINPREFMSAS